MANKNILLIEPGYKNKYPPLGLMKIAQYHGPRGKKDRVRFIKGQDPAENWLTHPWSLSANGAISRTSSTTSRSFFWRARASA